MSSADPSRPRILVFAGPNGSGKSTITKKIPICGIYVNADEIKRITRCTDLEAAQEAEQIRLSLLSAHKDFTFETVLSTDRNLALLRQAKEMGYEIQAVFVLTNDPHINVERVRSRVKAGGHDVPEEKADEIFAAAEGVFESLEHNGTPVRTESESYECSFFECEIPPKLAKGYAVGETLETGCYLCGDRNEQSCKLTVKAVLDGKDAAAHADETMSAENEKGSCERDTADFYGQQSHHLISRREADPNVKFVSNTSAEYWYFDNGSSVVEIIIETPEGMEQAFFDKVKPLLDSLRFKQ